ncbi:methyltransferase domain-containing protein [Micromonospora terminaliae]|uniref:Class I SAM-dependent methyltransferase n=1 Tax=Micromonospora terminaliae TaxID=1914461 RepID=A0AAJ2ZGQ5_9ACTN|nr:class I SAM-dependent methyltransferase [Micromonospora terminaliae]NES29306.1 class I SAM-dependent methyltransferase [Micromonospora terminaliae]QGL48713.1 methyltransferase domain-containing protein [Micromonospora terminaliae]
MAEFDRAYWEERYHHQHAAHPRTPTPYLVAEAGDLAPGTALDAGCGEGADAIWLAARGWRVTAVDVADGALRRAREHAAAQGAEVAGRVEWVRADLAGWRALEEGFDLVTSSYVHGAGEDLVDRLAAAVAPGGTLLVVGHDPTDPHTAAEGAPATAHVTAGRLAAGLDPARWEDVMAETRSRSVTAPDGRSSTLHDAVLRARRRG